MQEENGALLRRMEDLARRCEKTAAVTHSGFLTPAEGHAAEQWARSHTDCPILLLGGGRENERRCAFFLPPWAEEAPFPVGEYICALESESRFGEPGHRDYLGAALALGIQREWLGDIRIGTGGKAWLYCLPSVKQHLLLNLDHVGRWGVKLREISLEAVPEPERKLRETRFTVKSLRLDAVCAGMFGLSRGAAAEAIAQGLVSKNYAVCLKPDAPVQTGDTLSLRGRGKGYVLEAGGAETKKGRVFVRAGHPD